MLFEANFNSLRQAKDAAGREVGATNFELLLLVSDLSCSPRQCEALCKKGGRLGAWGFGR